jgi:preprotein translocase subunit SecA
MWLFSFLFGDPSNKKLKQYQKELEQIKSIEIKFREEISTIDQIQAKTHEFQSRFE